MKTTEMFKFAVLFAATTMAFYIGAKWGDAEGYHRGRVDGEMLGQRVDRRPDAFMYEGMIECWSHRQEVRCKIEDGRYTYFDGRSLIVSKSHIQYTEYCFMPWDNSVEFLRAKHNSSDPCRPGLPNQRSEPMTCVQRQKQIDEQATTHRCPAMNAR